MVMGVGSLMMSATVPQASPLCLNILEVAPLRAHFLLCVLIGGRAKYVCMYVCICAHMHMHVKARATLGAASAEAPPTSYAGLADQQAPGTSLFGLPNTGLTSVH